MNPTRRRNARIHAELVALARLGVLSEDQVRTLKPRYPVTPWDILALVRVFTILGVLSAVAGLVVLAREPLWRWLQLLFAHVNWWVVSELALAAAGLGLLAAGRWLRERKGVPVLGETVQLLGSAALQGLTTVLAMHYSTGSKDWPALVGIQALMLLAIAYWVTNRLVLWYACAVFFFWFGAETGYMSGWGCYWLGMTYPIRFLGAGLTAVGLSWLHGKYIRGRWTPFTRVYAHFGLLIINLALWFLSLFGYYENYDIRWSDTTGERLAYSLLWAGVAGASLFAGAKYGLRLLRGYGLTFLMINLYTFYFQFVVANTGEAWFLHLLLTGGSLLWLGGRLERQHAGAAPQEDGSAPGRPLAQD